MKNNLKWLIIILLPALLIYIKLNTNFIPDKLINNDFGLWSILPAFVTLFLCFKTKEVVTSLFVGIILGGIISGKFNIINEFIIPAVGSEKYGKILVVYLWGLGGLIGIWGKTGGAKFFAKWAGNKMAKTRIRTKLFAYLLGTLFHQGGTISTILAGSTVKPVADERNVSHEELSYIIDSTASPIATIIPFNAWPIYIGSLIVGTTPLFKDLDFSNLYLFSAIPFNFYSWIAILFTFLVSIEKMPWYGKKMKAAIERVKTTGKLDRDGSQPLVSKELTESETAKGYNPSLGDFFLPIITLLSVAIVPYFLSGKLYIEIAFIASVISAMILARAKGMNLKEIIEGFIDGCKGVTIGAIIIGLAVTLGNVSAELGTANFIIRTTSGLIIPFLLPAIFQFITMFISFSVGTSLGTYAVVFPIAMPLAYAINPDPMFTMLCFAAVTGGSVYGDNCSPISDTTILSAVATGTDLMDHVLTQLPLATLAAILSAILYTIITLFVL